MVYYPTKYEDDPLNWLAVVVLTPFAMGNIYIYVNTYVIIYKYTYIQMQYPVRKSKLRKVNDPVYQVVYL